MYLYIDKTNFQISISQDSRIAFRVYDHFSCLFLSSMLWHRSQDGQRCTFFNFVQSIKSNTVWRFADIKSSYLSKLIRSHNAVFLSSPAAEHDSPSRSPVFSLHNTRHSSGRLQHGCRTARRVERSEYPRITMITNHYISICEIITNYEGKATIKGKFK